MNEAEIRDVVALLELYAGQAKSQESQRSHTVLRRDRLIRRLYQEGGFGYKRLAKLTGLTAQGVKQIVLRDEVLQG